eukprot:3917709-Rhodomonas_salina.4
MCSAIHGSDSGYAASRHRSSTILRRCAKVPTLLSPDVGRVDVRNAVSSGDMGQNDVLCMVPAAICPRVSSSAMPGADVACCSTPLVQHPGALQLWKQPSSASLIVLLCLATLCPALTSEIAATRSARVTRKLTASAPSPISIILPLSSTLLLCDVRY